MIFVRNNVVNNCIINLDNCIISYSDCVNA